MKYRKKNCLSLNAPHIKHIVPMFDEIYAIEELLGEGTVD